MKIKFSSLLSEVDLTDLAGKRFSFTIQNMEADDKVNNIERTFEDSKNINSSFYNTTDLHVYSFYKPISKPIDIHIDNE